jgi:outer membrane phospholipase A
MNKIFWILVNLAMVLNPQQLLAATTASYPFTSHLRGFVQYFNGYGESLIYYNEPTQRLSIGVKMTDWL